MKGSDLKEILRKEGVVLMALAEDLGMSQQNLSAAFTRDDVKSGLLEKIAKSLGKTVGYFYGETPEMNSGESGASAGPDASVIDLLKIKDEQLLLAMKQTSKAQEQMDKVLEVLTRPTQHPVVAVKESTPIYIAKEGKMEPLTAQLRRRTAANIQGMVSAANDEVARVKALRDKKMEG